MTGATLRGRPVLRRGLIGLLVLLIVGGAAVAARGAATDGRAGYRVATAQSGSVVRTLIATGTVEPSNRADVSFAVGGTVGSVKVAAGDTVAAGQTVATLERAGRKAAVVAANADLATARAQLATDQAAPADTVSTSSETVADSPETGGANPSRPQARLAKQQQAVRKAQTSASEALAGARAALDAQTGSCSDGQNLACAVALTTVQEAQSTVADAQDGLQLAIGKLAVTLDETATDAAGDGSAEASANRIAADQAGVDAAKAALLRARLELARTTVVAPIAGTIASVDAVRRQQVSAGDAALVVVGAGSVRIETTVPESMVREVAVGQPTRVTPVGATDSSTGQVTTVGLVPDTSTGSARYPVTITVTVPAASMPAGSQAMLAIVLDSADDVLTVPSSAVSKRGGSATVSVLEKGGAPRRWSGPE